MYYITVPRAASRRAARSQLRLRPLPQRVQPLDPNCARRDADRAQRNAEDQQLRTRLLTLDARMRRQRSTLPPGWAPARST